MKDSPTSLFLQKYQTYIFLIVGIIGFIWITLSRDFPAIQKLQAQQQEQIRELDKKTAELNDHKIITNMKIESAEKQFAKIDANMEKIVDKMEELRGLILTMKSLSLGGNGNGKDRSKEKN